LICAARVPIDAGPRGTVGTGGRVLCPAPMVQFSGTKDPSPCPKYILMDKIKPCLLQTGFLYLLGQAIELFAQSGLFMGCIVFMQYAFGYAFIYQGGYL